MKKTICLILAMLIMLLAFASCGGDKPEESTAPSAEVTSVPDESAPEKTNTAEYCGISITLPDGFAEKSKDNNMITYVNEATPKDSISFNFDDNTQAKMENFASFTEKYIVALLQTEFPELEKLDTYTKKEINGLKCLCFSYKLTLDEKDYLMKQCFVLNGDKLIVVTLTDTTGTYITAFDECLNTISKLN